MRVDARPNARPTAKRLQFRRGCRHSDTEDNEQLVKFARQLSLSFALSLFRVSRPHWRVSFVLSYLVLVLSFLLHTSWHESRTKLQPNMRHREDQKASLHRYYSLKEQIHSFIPSLLISYFERIGYGSKEPPEMLLVGQRSLSFAWSDSHCSASAAS